MRANVNGKSIAAGAGAVGLLGVGLYLAVPAFADDPSPSSSPRVTASQQDKDKRDRAHGKHRPWKHRARWAARGVHGEATVRQKDGTFRVSTWQRGQITGVGGASVTVRSADGVSWTWTTTGKTRIRKNGDKAAVNALASGDRIVVIGERSGATRTATVIRVPQKR
jgi:hypothetical protein